MASLKSAVPNYGFTLSTSGQVAGVMFGLALPQIRPSVLIIHERRIFKSGHLFLGWV